MKKHVSAKHSNSNSNEKCKECKEDFKCVQDLQLYMINDHAERTRAPADREASIKDSGFTRTGFGVTVLCLHTAT